MAGERIEKGFYGPDSTRFSEEICNAVFESMKEGWNKKANYSWTTESEQKLLAKFKEISENATKKMIEEWFVEMPLWKLYCAAPQKEMIECLSTFVTNFLVDSMTNFTSASKYLKRRKEDILECFQKRLYNFDRRFNDGV